MSIRSQLIKWTLPLYVKVILGKQYAEIFKMTVSCVHCESTMLDNAQVCPHCHRAQHLLPPPKMKVFGGQHVDAPTGTVMRSAMSYRRTGQLP